MTDQKWCHAHMIGWFNDGPCPDCTAGVQATYPFYQAYQKALAESVGAKFRTVAAEVSMSVDANGSEVHVLDGYPCPGTWGMKPCPEFLRPEDVNKDGRRACWRCGHVS